MNINLLVVGKIKEKFYKDAVDEYKKRLSKYCNIQIIEVEDEKTQENISENEISIIKNKEGKRLLKHIKERDYVIALAINGRMYDSVGFSEFIESQAVSGHSTLCFVIGGSLGLSDEIVKRANCEISFSKMTFPHQLMRVILSEQIYRAFRIMNNEPYHK